MTSGPESESLAPDESGKGELPVPKLELVVLASGSGSNFEAIAGAIVSGSLPAVVKKVICNVPSAGVFSRAARLGIEAELLEHRGLTREVFDQLLSERVRLAFRPEIAATEGPPRSMQVVVLAGFMRVLGQRFLDQFTVLNIHPSLLPAFPGMHGPRQALARGVKISGCTVHLVDAGTDTGPILAQAAVPVLDTDDESTLAARILEQEHLLFPSVLRAIAEGKLVGSGNQRSLKGFDTARLSTQKVSPLDRGLSPEALHRGSPVGDTVSVRSAAQANLSSR